MLYWKNKGRYTPSPLIILVTWHNLLPLWIRTVLYLMRAILTTSSNKNCKKTYRMKQSYLLFYCILFAVSLNKKFCKGQARILTRAILRKFHRQAATFAARKKGKIKLSRQIRSIVALFWSCACLSQILAASRKFLVARQSLQINSSLQEGKKGECD